MDRARISRPADADAFVFLPSLTRLRAFSEVARSASIARASEVLRRSKSAVAQPIRKLESELGATLFDRTSSGSCLTEPGRTLARRTLFREHGAGAAQDHRLTRAGQGLPRDSRGAARPGRHARPLGHPRPDPGAERGA